MTSGERYGELSQAWPIDPVGALEFYCDVLTVARKKLEDDEIDFQEYVDHMEWFHDGFRDMFDHLFTGVVLEVGCEEVATQEAQTAGPPHIEGCDLEAIGAFSGIHLDFLDESEGQLAQPILEIYGAETDADPDFTNARIIQLPVDAIWFIDTVYDNREGPIGAN